MRQTLLHPFQTLRDRLTHHPLAAWFLLLVVLHAIAVGLLQGEGLMTSKEGVRTMERIVQAPVRGLVVVEVDRNAVSSVFTTFARTVGVPTSSTTRGGDVATETTSQEPLTTTEAARSRNSMAFASTTQGREESSTTRGGAFETVPAARPTSGRFVPVSNFATNDEVTAELDDEKEKEITLAADGGARSVKRAVGAGAEWSGVDPMPFDELDARLFVVAGLEDVDGKQLFVTVECASALARPIAWIKRLDTMQFTFLLFELWLLFLSILGLLYESVPHLAAVATSHLLAAVYAIFQVTQTQHFHDVFHRDIAESACAETTTLIPGFWDLTISFQTAVAVIQSLGVVVISVAAWRLTSVLEFRTFRKIGADRRAKRVHIATLLFELFLDKALFFVLAFQGLWLHELCTFAWPDTLRETGSRTVLSPAYKVILGIATGLLLPLLIAGWFAVRQQKRWLMHVFLGGNVAFLAHTIFLATQRVYTDTLTTFRFLTFMGAVATVIVAILGVLGVVALLHFDTFAPKSLAVDWITPFPLESKEYDLEKASFEVPTTPQTIIVSLPRPEAIVVPSLPRPDIRRELSYTPGDDTRPLPTQRNSYSTPSSSPLKLERTTSNLSSKNRPDLRIDTTTAALTNASNIKNVVAVNDFEFLASSPTYARLSTKEQSRWSESTSTKARSSSAKGRSRWSNSTRTESEEGGGYVAPEWSARVMGGGAVTRDGSESGGTFGRRRSRE